MGFIWFWIVAVMIVAYVVFTFIVTDWRLK